MSWHSVSMSQHLLIKVQVGPVFDPAKPESVEEYKGQYMSAGYSGHGMPRGFAW